MPNPCFSVVIATRNRRSDLQECLHSIAAQTLPPSEVLIVDASQPVLGDEQELYQASSGSVPVTYVRAQSLGSSRQRNQGLDLLASDSEYVLFLDDDVVLEPDYCHMLLQAMDDDRVVGAGGNITNWQGYPYNWWVQAFFRLFMMEGKPGTLLPSGQVGHIAENQQGDAFPIEWLQGCTMAVRRSAATEIVFDPDYERFAGYAFNEDLDYSYSVGQRGRMLCVPTARLVHKMSPAARLNDYRFGISQVANRALFVHKHLPGTLHFACYLWSMIGTMLINALMIVRGRSHTRLLGNFIGLALVLTGQVRAAGK